jgi:hypothetical protein
LIKGGYRRRTRSTFGRPLTVRLHGSGTSRVPGTPQHEHARTANHLSRRSTDSSAMSGVVILATRS